jgi:hypothetical protein
MSVMAQDVTVDKLMTEYSAKSHCTTIDLSSGMLRTMGVEMGADSLKAISVSDTELIDRFKMQIAVLVDGFESIMAVNSNGHSVEIYQRSDGSGGITDLVIVTAEGGECVMTYIRGKNLELSAVNAYSNAK